MLPYAVMKTALLFVFATVAACHGSAAPTSAAVVVPAVAVAAPIAPTAVAAPAVAAATAAKPGDPPLLAVGTKTKCAVTGEDFTVTAKTAQTVYEGKRYAFCCPDCAPQFAADPKKYARK